jgi:hypothetical protein
MRFIVVALLILSCATASSQINDSHRRVAEKLPEIMDVKSSVAGASQAMADAMAVQNPTLAPYRSVIVDWAVISFTWENFEGKFVDIYVDSYSESELRDLIAFYETPTGQKTVRLQPEMMKKGAMLGAQIGEENSDLLTKMIEERAAELERLGN